MDITIQRARQSDQEYIDEKIKKYLLDPEDAVWDRFFVVAHDGKTVAFGRIIDHGEYLEIASLGVDYYFRGKGIGLKLLTFLTQKARETASGKDIYGVTHLPGFLEKVGFEKIPEGPEELEYKRHSKCKLDASKIKIMRFVKSS